MESKAKKNTTKKGTTSKKGTAKKAVTKSTPVKKGVTSAKNTKAKKEVKIETKVNKQVKETEKVAKKEEVKKTVKKEESLGSNLKAFFSSDLGKLIEIVAIIAVIILVFFFVTNLIKKNANKENTNNSEVYIQYNEILISNLLKQNNKEYYVFIYDTEDMYNATYNSYITMYNLKENAVKFYRADLNSGFNKNFVAEESKITSNMDEFKVKGSTLIKVANAKVVASYQTSEDILGHLKSLAN